MRLFRQAASQGEKAAAAGTGIERHHPRRIDVQVDHGFLGKAKWKYYEQHITIQVPTEVSDNLPASSRAHSSVAESSSEVGSILDS